MEEEEVLMVPRVEQLTVHARRTLATNTTEDLSLEKFYTSIYINLTIGALCIIGFSLIHRRKIFHLYKFYAPRKKAIDNPISATFWKSLVLWIWQSLRYQDERLWRTHGPDALVYVQFIRLCLWLSVGLMFVGVTVILPINFSGNDPSVTEMGQFTISNLDNNDSRLIAHIVFTYLYSFGGYFVLWRSFRNYAIVRRRYMDRSEPRSFTLLLRDIPDRLMDKPELQRWFEDHLRTKVVDVQFVYSAQSLDRLKKKRNKYLDKLERAELQFQYRKQKHEHRQQKREVGLWDRFVDATVYYMTLKCLWGSRKHGDYQSLDDLRPVKRLGWSCFALFGPKVDAIAYYRDKIKRINKVIKNHLRSTVVEKRFRKAHSAFVTFDSMYPARAPPQPFIDPHLMRLEAAPDPSDVNWSQVTIPFFSRLVRMGLVSGALTVLIVVWIFPVVAVQSLANLQTLSRVEYLSWLQPIIDVINEISPQLLPIIEGYLPSLVLLIFISITKPIIAFLYSHQGESSHSAIEWKTMATYWGFLIINVFLVSTVGGTLFKVLDDFIANPRSIVDLLAGSLPQQSGFFINYLLVIAFGRLPLKLFRIPALVQRIFTILLCRPVTEREKKKRYRPEPFDYSLEVAEELLVFTVTLCYSLMAPLITVFGFAYFVLVFFINRYNLIYVNEQRWQGGGTMWEFVYHLFMSAILLFQLIMLGILGLSQYGGGFTLTALPFITAFLWFTIHRYWHHTTTGGPLEGTDVLRPTSWDDFVGAYLQPPLQNEEEDVVDDGWYDEDAESSASPDRTVKPLDESTLAGAELWSWKTSQMQTTLRRGKNKLLGSKANHAFISPLLDPLLGDDLLLDLTSDADDDDNDEEKDRGTYQRPRLGSDADGSGSSNGSNGGSNGGGEASRRSRRGSDEARRKSETRRSKEKGKMTDKQTSARHRSIEEVEREEDAGVRYSVGGDVERGEIGGWTRRRSSGDDGEDAAEPVHIVPGVEQQLEGAQQAMPVPPVRRRSGAGAAAGEREDSVEATSDESSLGSSEDSKLVRLN